MLLAIDVGNTNAVFSAGEDLLETWRIATRRETTRDSTDHPAAVLRGPATRPRTQARDRVSGAADAATLTDMRADQAAAARGG
jgi:pantothenate kinase type III